MGHSRLDCIKSLEALARRVNYNLRDLARAARTSPRQLRRYVWNTRAKPLHEWLLEQRLRKAIKLRRRGFTLKEIAALIDFKHISHLCRLLKRAKDQGYLHADNNGKSKPLPAALATANSPRIRQAPQNN